MVLKVIFEVTKHLFHRIYTVAIEGYQLVGKPSQSLGHGELSSYLILLLI